MQNYNYTDILTNDENVLYYRLKQVDFNGRSSLSGIEKVFFANNEDNNILIYPNPVNDKINIDYNSVADKNITISLFNSQANLIKKETFDVKTGYNLLKLDVKSLRSSIYFLQIQDKEGNIYNSKVIKK